MVPMMQQWGIVLIALNTVAFGCPGARTTDMSVKTVARRVASAIKAGNYHRKSNRVRQCLCVDLNASWQYIIIFNCSCILSEGGDNRDKKGVCRDSDENCDSWTSHCTSHRYVKTHCKLTCNLCGV